MQEIYLGQYTLPFVLTAILGFLFKMIAPGGNQAEIPNKLKLSMAVICGMILGLASLQYSGGPWNFTSVVDCILYGFMVGTSAIGVNELRKGG